jgi:murein DD-endopeptidase MepM/ murein hydrolase activator NlpD
MRQPRWETVAYSAAGGFVAGAICVAVLMQWPGRTTGQAVQIRPAALMAPEVSTPQPPAGLSGAGGDAARIGLEPLRDLRNRKLNLPVRGVSPAQLVESFDDVRGEGKHEAIDILAPRHSEVLAVEDGTIAKLFQSKAGGTTIYQFDPAMTYTYYYAHLESYANDLREGQRVRRGEVLGYVGTSGNAPKNTPHLHFAIFKLGQSKKWWEGVPIDPYAVLQ